MGVGVGTADFVGVGFGVGRVVGIGVGVDVGVAAATSGDGTAGELMAIALGTVLAELRLAALAALVAAVLGELTAGVDPADDGWLLVHAPSVATQRTATSQRAGVGLVVRSRLAIDPG